MRRILIAVGLAIGLLSLAVCVRNAANSEDQAPTLDVGSQNNCLKDTDCDPDKICVPGPYASQGCFGQCAHPEFSQTCTTNIVNAEGKNITTELNQLCNIGQSSANQSEASVAQKYWFCPGATPQNCPYYFAQNGFCGCCKEGETGCYNYTNKNGVESVTPYCVDLQNDLNNCGTCGNVCPDGTQCSNGVCTSLCPIGETYCSSRNTATTCYATQKDANNCGGINVVCSAAQMCLEGKCTNCDTPNPKAKTGAIACAGNGPDGTSATNQYRTCVGIDSNNCGACGAICSGAEICAWQGNGQAISATNPAAKCCSVETDANHPQVMEVCGNTCKDSSIDISNCGGCGIQCGKNQECVPNSKYADHPNTEKPGECKCLSQYPNLGPDGNCYDYSSDSKNCGTYGRLCTGVQNACINGNCSCPQGTMLCNGQCVNLKTDNNNCGSCGHTCDSETPGFVCTSGTCGCLNDNRCSTCGSNCGEIGQNLPYCSYNCTGNEVPSCSSLCTGTSLPQCQNNCCSAGPMPLCSGSTCFTNPPICQ